MMKKILFAVALLLFTHIASADQYDAIRKDIEHEIATGHATGAAVALTGHGKIIWQEGFGWADKAHGRRVTPDTSFSLASVTKTFTTTALMALVAKGRISLNGRANDYLGAAKIHAGVGNPDDVTVRMLASHSSGLPGTFQMFPANGPLKQPPMDEVIREYGVLVTPPGERFNYSNVGMGIVAHIVALRSGKDFGQFLRDHVLNPLGLKHSFFDTDLSRRDEMAQRYGDDGKPFPFYVTSTPGTGELYASAHDLARYAMFHLKDHLKGQQAILTDAQIDELHKPVIRAIANRSYGLGWMIGHAYDGSTVVYHNGNQPGVNTVVMLWPSRDIAVVVLTNQEGDYDLLERVRDAALRTLVPQWNWKTVSSPPATKLPESYHGTWRGVVHDEARTIPIKLTIDEKGATLQIRGQKPQPVSNLGMQQGMMMGQMHGNLGFPVTRAVHSNQIALRLKLRGSKLEGEVGAEATIPHAGAPQYVPFWAEFSREGSAHRNLSADKASGRVAAGGYQGAEVHVGEACTVTCRPPSG